MTRAVLFDLDGVLIDTYEVWHALINDVAARLGYPAVPPERYHASWGQGIEADVAAFYPGHTVDAIRLLYDRHYESHLPKLLVMAGAPQALPAIRLPKAVITNSPRSIAGKALALAGLREFFRTIVGSDDVPRSKPAPDMVLEACRRLDAPPADALVVGDSRFDEEAARAAGAPFVRFRSFAEFRTQAPYLF